MRRPDDDDDLTPDDRFREVAQILAVGILRLLRHPTQVAHVPPGQNLPDSSIHVLEPHPQPSLIH